MIAIAWVVFGVSLVDCVAGSIDASGRLVASLWTMSACRVELDDVGALSLHRIWLDGQWWRLLSAAVVHGSWLHLVLNSWSAFAVGEWAERAWGWWRVGLVFVGSCVAGGLASAAWVEAPMVVGMSGGVLGVAAALLVGRLWATGRVAALLRPVSARALGGTLAVLVALGFFVPVIAQAGHLGGLAFGAIGGVWLARPAYRAPAAAGAVVLVAGLIVGTLNPDWRPKYDEFVGFAYLDRGEPETGVQWLERALAKAPGDPVLSNAVAYGMAEAGVELDRAEQLVQVALEAEPENADYLDTMGWILCRRGDADGGQPYLEEANEASGGRDPVIREHVETCGQANVPRETPR